MMTMTITQTDNDILNLWPYL